MTESRFSVERFRRHFEFLSEEGALLRPQVRRTSRKDEIVELEPSLCVNRGLERNP